MLVFVDKAVVEYRESSNRRCQIFLNFEIHKSLQGVKMSDANVRSLVLDDHTILRGEGVTDHYAHGIILQRVRVVANVKIVSLA